MSGPSSNHHSGVSLGRGRGAAIPVSPSAPRATPLGQGSGRGGIGPRSASRATQLGLGLGPSRGPGGGLGAGLFGRGGLGLAKGGAKRHMKVQRDSIQGISKNEIRRLARRGGVKRISAMVYHDIRQALKDRLTMVLKDICAIIDSSGRKTVVVTDVVYALRLKLEQKMGANGESHSVERPFMALRSGGKAVYAPTLPRTREVP
ncbi:histone h4 [Curvularia clavata]|uniref:Histone H4 n=1 Tax=Curvularia clavata TaxID=95742 RepID=A0A9Q9DQ79_CURCL|nr:histone h4 [Curvularia clavata]